MVTISLCMIVKNEEKILARCLDSLKGIYDEAIIVDTGSTDATKEIAHRYTNKVFDFKWIDDFAAARNYAMEQATCNYIYMADADEVLDEENRKKFLALKQVLDGSVEIVQMTYANQLSNGSVYNFDKELRAKLYKRVRNFTFVDPIHEVVREAPVVFDSDIEILHLQESTHSDRDLLTFEKAIKKNGRLSNRLCLLYARELYKAGTKEHFQNASEFFETVAGESSDEDLIKAADIVLAKKAFLCDDVCSLMKYSLKDVATEGSCEMCCILGDFFYQKGDWKEATVWYYNAAFETKPAMDIDASASVPIKALVRIFEEQGDMETAQFYRQKLEETGA